MRAAARRQAKVVADAMKQRSDILRYEKSREEAARAQKEQRRQQKVRAAAQVFHFVATSCIVVRRLYVNVSCDYDSALRSKLDRTNKANCIDKSKNIKSVWKKSN